MKDFANDFLPEPSISAITQTNSDTAIAGQVHDLSGCESAAWVISIGRLTDTDATFTVLVQDDDASGFGTAAAVADEYLIGTEAGASFTVANDHEVRKIGYIGPKRYVKLTITPSGNNSGAASLSAVLLKFGLRVLPQTSQG